jgi:CubicO group peptidase (beta-lactamase class C family)
MSNEKLHQDPMAVRTSEDWYRIVRDLPLDFEPGTKQQYSNGGYVLLGRIITRASGEDYYDYIRRHIYQPAGMTRSDSYASDEKVDGIASGYTRRGGHSVGDGSRTPDGLAVLPGGHHFGRGSAAGGGYSTVGDLAKFSRALRAGKLKHLAAGQKPSGLGIAGGSPGVNALLVMHGPYTLAILANLDPPAAERFARTVGSMVRRAAGEPAGERKVVRAGGGS